jgi:hypothetical protein
MTLGRFKSLDMIVNPIGWLKEMLATRGLGWFCGRYYGLYEGTVIDNADPQGRYRIRATCPAIRLVKPEDVSDDYWMLPSMPGLGTDPESNQATGLFHPPDEGTRVWIMFRDGKPRFPVYIGGYVTRKTESDTFQDKDGAFVKGWRTKTGHYVRMSDEDGDLHLILGKGDGEGGPSPMFLSMTKEGHLLVTNEVGSTLFMNAEKPETSILTANDKGEVTSMLMLGDDKITLATKSGGAVGISGKNVTLTGKNVVANAEKQFAADAGTVMLGKGASEPLVRGNKLIQWALLHQHTISVPTPGSSTITGATPPPMLYNELSEKVFTS